jgi:hypothetical protein
MAVDCATKPPPQMAAASNRRRFAWTRVISVLDVGQAVSRTVTSCISFGQGRRRARCECRECVHGRKNDRPVTPELRLPKSSA